MKTLITTALLLIATSSFAQDAPKKALSDDAIAKILIKESIADYPGNCACPYNTTRNGSRCGKRSAYSKPGGADPLCYRRDVTDAMIEAYRAQEAE